MPAQWAAQINAATPPTAGVVVDMVETPAFETPQPFTISFDRIVPASENSIMRAEITYRTGALSRSVVCDWRGQASVTAEQVEVKAKSIQLMGGTYVQNTVAQMYSVMVGLGALAKSSVLCTGAPTSCSLTSPEPIEIPVNRMATRLILRAARDTGGALTGDIVDDLIGAGRIELARLQGGYIFHGEALQPSHFLQGIDLGEADSVWITTPSGLAGDNVLYTPVFELAL